MPYEKTVFSGRFPDDACRLQGVRPKGPQTEMELLEIVEFCFGPHLSFSTVTLPIWTYLGVLVAGLKFRLRRFHCREDIHFWV